MLSCNIGPKNRLVRGITGFFVNFIVILLAPQIPTWLFWVGIVLSYAIVLQGVVGWCYINALLGKKDMS